jgi:UDP-N-acetylglucosamine 2-epimerase (non-hydrolysing)
MNKNIIVVVGTRPNFMKAAPLLREIKKVENLNITLVHTGQHYDKKMSDNFFRDLEIQEPNFNLNVGSSSHAKQTSKIMVSFEEICLNINPELVIVFGDVNSTMACSIVASKLNIDLAHIEAGLRSYDREMPEEINRLITDSISDYFFVTEESGEKNLLKEGHSNSKIYSVGNLMIDSLHFGLKKIESRELFLDENYCLVTLHRPSNVDDIKNFNNIMEALSSIARNVKIFFSIHPRTKQKIKDFKIKLDKNINILEPLSYLNFLHIMRDSKAVFTDSGGIQEETTALKIPCYTLRENTERPITIEQGTNRLVGVNKKTIINSFSKNKFSVGRNYKLPLNWDGKSSQRIVEILKKIL